MWTRTPSAKVWKTFRAFRSATFRVQAAAVAAAVVVAALAVRRARQPRPFCRRWMSLLELVPVGASAVVAVVVVAARLEAQAAMARDCAMSPAAPTTFQFCRHRFANFFRRWAWI